MTPRRRNLWKNLLLVTICLATGCAAMAADGNLIANGDFEGATRQDPARGWKPDKRMAEQILRLDAREKLSGRHALAIEMIRGHGKGSWAVLSQEVKVRPNRWHLFRANYKRDSFVYGGSFKVTLYKGAKMRRRHDVNFRSKRWTAEELIFDSEDADRAVISVYVSADDVWRLSVGGTVWLDDVSLVELSSAQNIHRRVTGKRRSVTLDVTSKVSAPHYLWLRWRQPKMTRGAATVSIDGGPAEVIACYQTGKFVWTRPVTPKLPLKAGRHRITLKMSTPGAELRDVILTPNPCFYPRGVKRDYADGPARAAALKRKGFIAVKGGVVPLTLVPPSKDKPAFKTTWPLAQGVPLARGHVSAMTRFRLLDASGKPLNTGLQTHPLAHWPDGSVQWMLVQALLPVDSANPSQYKLEYGTSASIPRSRGRKLTKDDGKTVTVDTGMLRFTLDRRRPGLFASLTVAGNGVDLAPASRTDVPPREIVVEERGPVRAVIKVVRTQKLPTGGELEHVIRLYAWAGERFVKIDHTFVARKDAPRTLKLGEVALNIPLKLSRKAKAHVGGQGDAAVEASLGRGNVRLLQDGHYDPKKRKGAHEFTLTNGKTKVAEGKEAAGWIAVEDAKLSCRVTMRSFWQNYPKGYEVSHGGVKVQFVPKLAKPFLFYAGQAKTHELLLDFTVNPDERLAHARAFAGWPVLLADPKWTAKTGALGRFGQYDPEKYAAYEHQIDDVYERYFASTAKAQKSGVAMGLMHFGDKPQGRGKFNNLETALGEGMLIQFFRTGNRRYLDYAEPALRHFSDIDIDHSDSVGGGIYVHGPHERPKEPVSYFGNNGHSWFVGVRNLYFLTGDRRYRDQAMQVGDWYVKHPWPLMPRIHYWRQIAWNGMALLSAYEMTGEARFLKAAGAVVGVTDYQKDHIGTLWPYMFSVGTRVARWYYEKTEDPVARATFLHIMDDYLGRRLDPRDNSFGADAKNEGMLLGNYPAARELNYYNELAWATRLSGDDSYVRLGARDLNIQTKFRLASDVLLWGSADLIGEMQRLEVPGARHYADSRWVYCIHDPRMVFQVVEERDQPFLINLYTSRSTKYCMDYGAKATLYDPKGKPIQTLDMRAGGLNEVRFTAPRDGQTGIYTVVVNVTDFWRWTLHRVAFDLKPGEHVMEISGREVRKGKRQGTLYKTKLDAWLLTDDPLYRPSRADSRKRAGMTYLRVEGESGECSGPMKAGTHAMASGKRFVEDVGGKDTARVRYRFKVDRAGRYHFFGRVGMLSPLNRWLFASIDGGKPVHFYKTHTMSGTPMPLWSLSTSLGPKAVVQYWHEPGHKGNTYYRSQYLKKDGPIH